MNKSIQIGDATSRESLLDIAKRVFTLECEALVSTADQLGDDFLAVIELISSCRGKVIVTGLGKSGIAAKKIAATLASTGSPALFLHSAEAGHGDLGVVSNGDVVIALSYSGETHELVELVPRFKLLGAPVIAITGTIGSSLAGLCDIVLGVSVPPHSWPFGTIPTASNAATVALGDALAVALLVRKGIQEEDFATFHPSGLLGRKLLIRVSELMHHGAEMPVVSLESGFRDVLMEMTAKRLGVACILDEDGKLLGIFTDGDLRRLLERNPNPLELSAEQIMTRSPLWVTPEILSAKALHVMQAKSITSLPVLDESGVLLGIVHMHDIIRLETSK